MASPTTADISESAGARAILDAVRERWPRLEHLFADGAYDRTKLLDKAAFKDLVPEIARRAGRLASRSCQAGRSSSISSAG